MTKDELSKLYWLNREIEREKRRLDELTAAAESVTASITGLPHVTGNSRRSEDIMILLAEQREFVDLKVKESVIEYNRLNRYIASVDDPLMREILALRFVNGLSWRQVAASLGGGNTAESVRKMCERYLKK